MTLWGPGYDSGPPPPSSPGSLDDVDKSNFESISKVSFAGGAPSRPLLHSPRRLAPPLTASDVSVCSVATAVGDGNQARRIGEVSGVLSSFDFATATAAAASATAQASQLTRSVAVTLEDFCCAS